MAMRGTKGRPRLAVEGSTPYRGYAAIAECPTCHFQRAIVAGGTECVECQGASYKKTQQLAREVATLAREVSPA